tara:strand:- start:4572 stop:4988 length:417 start_codon:yes stop_codon:yes gene_type:complete
MKIKIIILFSFLTYQSCGILTKVQDSSESSVVNLDRLDLESKFIGKYDLEVFNLPDGRDGKFKMTVKKDGNILKTIFDDPSSADEFDILNTEIEEGILYIDVYVKDIGVNVFFEIYVDGNNVSGYLADMFKLEGKKIN